MIESSTAAFRFGESTWSIAWLTANRDRILRNLKTPPLVWFIEQIDIHCRIRNGFLNSQPDGINRGMRVRSNVIRAECWFAERIAVNRSSKKLLTRHLSSAFVPSSAAQKSVRCCSSRVLHFGGSAVRMGTDEGARLLVRQCIFVSFYLYRLCSL